VYPQPSDLITIYDKVIGSIDQRRRCILTYLQTVPKPVLDILAEMIAADGDLKVGSFGQESATD